MATDRGAGRVAGEEAWPVQETSDTYPAPWTACAVNNEGRGSKQSVSTVERR